jgi:hypothetical protein
MNTGHDYTMACFCSSHMVIEHCFKNDCRNHGVPQALYNCMHPGGCQLPNKHCSDC